MSSITLLDANGPYFTDGLTFTEVADLERGSMVVGFDGRLPVKLAVVDIVEAEDPIGTYTVTLVEFGKPGSPRRVMNLEGDLEIANADSYFL